MDQLYPYSRTQEVLIALRDFLNRSRCFAGFESESLSELLYQEHLLPYRPPVHEVEAALEALAGEEGVLP